MKQTKRKLSEVVDKDEFINFIKGRTTKEASEHFGLSMRTINSLLDKYDVKHLRKRMLRKARTLEEILSKEELLQFLGGTPNKTYNDIRQHFKLRDYDTAKNIVSKYELQDLIYTETTKFEGLEDHVSSGDWTYDDVAKKFDLTYKQAYRAINSRGLSHLIKRGKAGHTKDFYDKTLEDFIRCGTKTYDDIAEHYKITYWSAWRNIKDRELQHYVREPSSEEIQSKAKETTFSRYGVENVMQADEVKRKVKNTLLERYGVDSVMKIPGMIERIRHKAAKTNLKRYGKSTNFKSEEGVLNARKTLLDNEYRNSRNWPEINEENAKILLDKDLFIKTVEGYKDKPSIVEFIANKDLPIRTVYNYISNNNLSYLFKESKVGESFAEDTVYKFILELGIAEEDIVRHNRTIIKPYELDIYIPKHNLSIEFNGTYYHSTERAIDNNRHQIKSQMAEDKGILLYHIFEYDWNRPQKQEIIKSQIRNILQLNEHKIYARQCKIKNVDYKEAKKFIDENHLQGDGNLNKQINYGLYYKDELVYIMTFGKWRRGFKGVLDYEIFRSCSKLNTTVVGGASKLFKHFTKNYPNATIGTYSSMQTGDGSLYEQLGFEFSHTTTPTAIKVTPRGEVYTMFSRAYKNNEGIQLDEEERVFKIYGAGNKLWMYNVNKKDKDINKKEDGK